MGDFKKGLANFSVDGDSSFHFGHLGAARSQRSEYTLKLMIIPFSPSGRTNVSGTVGPPFDPPQSGSQRGGRGSEPKLEREGEGGIASMVFSFAQASCA